MSRWATRRVCSAKCATGSRTKRCSPDPPAWKSMSDWCGMPNGSSVPGLDAPVSFVECDLMSSFAAGSMVLIVSNPPYVRLGEKTSLQRDVRDWQPHEALFAGPTGLEIYERLVRDAERVLGPGGWLIMELGLNTSDRVAAMFSSRWRNLETVPDLAGIPRVMVGQASWPVSAD